jgi:hypothetical protein
MIVVKSASPVRRPSPLYQCRRSQGGEEGQIGSMAAGQSARRSVLVAEARQGVAAGLVRVTSRLAAHSEHDLDAQQSHTRYDK